MKYLLLGIALLFTGCATTNLPPMEPSQQLMEQADRVIVTIDESPKEAFRNLGQYLSDLGFAFHSANSQLLSIQTNYKAYGINEGHLFGSFNLRVNASVRDSTIHFYGLTGSQMFGEFEVDSRADNAWDELVEIATGYPHQEIYYSRN